MVTRTSKISAKCVVKKKGEKEESDPSVDLNYPLVKINHNWFLRDVANPIAIG